jgi:CRISPR-associated protein Cas1
MERTFYIFSNGEIKRKENTIFIETEKGKKFIPVEEVEQIYLMGENTFNTKLIDFLSQNNIILHFFNYYGFYTGSFYPREENLSGKLIIQQAENYLNYEKRLKFAKAFVEGSLHNLARILEKRGFGEEFNSIKVIEKDIEELKSINEIMLKEAMARKIYYSSFEKITGWEFEERSMRPPKNPLNAMISFGNSILYTCILKEIYKTPLNPTISFLHEPFERRFSLCLDISEIFKPIFVDRLIFKLINNSMIKDEDFLKELNFCYLNEDGRKRFIEEFDKLQEETILHRGLKRKIKYKNLIRLELYKLIKGLLGEKEYKPLKVWW